ncbi:MAG: RNA degradosome polyphosphate kinase [Actinobacteria bacterium]|nr:RNA degradosome polyphosphate kinase [Actinomycetota bacterium]
MESQAPDFDRFINRELSWLDFNARVLTLAEDSGIPLLERAKFLAIFASNLDEFYMVRVAGLMRQVEAGVSRVSPDGLGPTEQLKWISDKSLSLVERHTQIFLEDVLPALNDKDIHVKRWGELDDLQRKELDELFRHRIFPVVTPLAVDPSHPFPYISNRSLNLAVLVREPGTSDTRFARVKVPALLPRFVELSSEALFVPLEDVIAANLGKLFPGMDVLEHHAFRVTRNADLDLDDDGAEDLLQALEEELRKSLRFSPAVRLECERGMPDRILELLMRELQISRDDVHTLMGPLDLSGLWDLYALDRPDLKDEPFKPVTPAALVTADDSPADVLTVMRREDLLLHHPYQSFTTSVQRFVEQAAHDPAVLAIKQTLYRTEGQSAIVDALAEAAQAGKQVLVLVEVKARFDEQANIQWARMLEHAGCHVVYGVVGLKTHCKLCLVVRQESDGLRRYVHLGTGNYNAGTARLYEDIGLLTANDSMGADVSDLFNFLTGYSRQTRYRRLVVAPHGLRGHFKSLIQREIEHATTGSAGRIIIKCNSVVDPELIDDFYAASQAGVEIDLIVRGISALRPGVAGMSDNIRVRSILGRFLEHSRVFYFGNGGDDDYYIGSADLMQRNLDRRVEALISIDAHPAKEALGAFLDLQLDARIERWELLPDGTWNRARGDEFRDVQKVLMGRVAGDHA